MRAGGRALSVLCGVEHPGSTRTQAPAHDGRAAAFAPPPPEAPPEPAEPRVLGDEAFLALFSSLRQQDLSDILAGIGANRVTGAKDHLVKLLKETRFSEATLLLELNLKQLEAALDKAKLKAGGSKREKVERLLANNWSTLVQG